jgi:hypothetical protein
MTTRYRWRADYRNLAGERCTAYSKVFDLDDPVAGAERARFYREDLFYIITRKTNLKIAQKAHLVLVADDITPTTP